MPLVNRTFDQLINFTRTTAATFVGSNGLIQTTPQSRNLLTFTEEFNNAAWVKSSATVAANSVAAPDGTMTADTLTASGANGTALQTFTASAVPYTFSVWLRRLTGTGNVQLTVDGTTYATVTLTTAWARFETTLTPSAGSRTAGVRIVTSGDAVYAWGAQLEQASAATDYTKNVGGLYPPRFDYDPVTLAPKGLLIEEQRTNLLTYSNDFTNGIWAKTSATITGGVADPAGGTSAVTITATAAAAVVQQAPTVTSGVALSASIWIKRRTGTGTINMRCGDATLIPITVTSSWTRVPVTATPTSTTGRFAVTIATSGDEVDIYGAQLEAGAFATSYIPTVASQVTRTADIAAIAAPNFASWYNQSEGTLLVEGSVQFGSTRYFFAGSAAQRMAYGTSGGALGIFDGTNAAASASGIPSGQTFKLATSYSNSNGLAGSLDGSAVFTNSAYTGSFATMTSVGLFNVAAGTAPATGHIRSIRYYPTRLSNAQLQALTA